MHVTTGTSRYQTSHHLNMTKECIPPPPPQTCPQSHTEIKILIESPAPFPLVKEVMPVVAPHWRRGQKPADDVTSKDPLCWVQGRWRNSQLFCLESQRWEQQHSFMAPLFEEKYECFKTVLFISPFYTVFSCHCEDFSAASQTASRSWCNVHL